MFVLLCIYGKVTNTLKLLLKGRGDNWYNKRINANEENQDDLVSFIATTNLKSKKKKLSKF